MISMSDANDTSGTDRSEQGPDPDDFRIPTIAELDAMRVTANLSMKDLSECAGFKTSRFSHILNNEVNPQTRTIRAFLTALQEFDGHSTSGDQGPDPSRSGLAADEDGPTEVDVDQIAARLDRLNADDVGDDPTPPDPDETLLPDGGAIEDDTEQWDGRPARTVDSLTGMLGWNSVAVFKAGEHRDGDRLKVNKATVFVMLADPWPEYSTAVFLNGEFHHEGHLLAGEHEDVFEAHLDDYGKAEIVPLSEVGFLQRDEGGIPCYVDTVTERSEADR